MRNIKNKKAAGKYEITEEMCNIICPLKVVVYLKTGSLL